MFKRILQGVAVALALSTAAAAAPIQAIDAPHEPAVFGNSRFTAGFQFTANADLDVTALGNYDYQDNGFRLTGTIPGRAEIGLFDTLGNLLASTTILGNGGYLLGNFRYQDLLAPVRLMAGLDYVIATWSNDPRYYFLTSWQRKGGGSLDISVDDHITLAGNLNSGRSDGLLFPTATVITSSGRAAANIGPNMLFEPVEVATVPVPAAGLMLVSGLGAIALLRRRQRA